MAGPGQSDAEPDLDVLIGEIRREAARRRAAPDFPLDDEARVALEMDRDGPSGGGVDLPAVLAALRDAASGVTTGSTGAPGGEPGASPGAGRMADVAELARLVESLGRGLASRVADLERRVERLSPPPIPADPDRGSGPALPEVVPLDHWMPVVDEMVRSGETTAGRVLVAGPGVADWVDHLSALGVDAYGVDPSLPLHGDDGPVRAGGVAAHLQSVGENGLHRVLLIGPLATAELAHLDRWAAALAARTASVAVLSETLWWWRQRLGPVAADTSPWRPAAAETWMAVLHDAGFRVAGRFGPGGRDYCVVAHRQVEGGPGEP